MEITKEAVEELKKMVKESGEKDAGVRIDAVGSCCGVSFNMEVTGKGKSDDNTVDFDGLKVFVSKNAQQKLADSTIGFTASGEFSIRGASSSCCG